MKYLRRYNESYNTCKSLTGYSYDELKEIFELNLEDNSEFELSNVDGIIDNEGPNDIEVMSIELIEDFSNNDMIAKYTANSSGYSQREVINDEIARINTKILYLIAKKYDLNIYNIDVLDYRGNNQYRVKFTVKR
jgi:hypothetical protein